MSKFDKNLLHFSNSENIDKAILEWAFIMRKSHDERDGHCICKKKIKHINYFFNIENKIMIETGDSCKKKLRLEKVDKKTLSNHKILFDRITQGQPIEEIDYEKYIIKVYKHYVEDLQKYSNNIIEMYKIKDIILNLIKLNLYKGEQMNKLLKKINDALEHLELVEDKKRLHKTTVLEHLELVEDKKRLHKTTVLEHLELVEDKKILYKTTVLEQMRRRNRNDKLCDENNEKLCQISFGKHCNRTYIDIYNNKPEYIEWLKGEKPYGCNNYAVERFLIWEKNYPVKVTREIAKCFLDKKPTTIERDEELETYCFYNTKSTGNKCYMNKYYRDILKTYKTTIS